MISVERLKELREEVTYRLELVDSASSSLAHFREYHEDLATALTELIYLKENLR